jgi:L-lactate dehydrogenase
VIGSGTVLDSARLRYLISEKCTVDVGNVHAYILGEHGDSQPAAWSLSHIGGISIENYCPLCKKCDDGFAERKKIEQEVKQSAYHIIDYKGATYYAVGLALVRITEAVLRNQRSVLTVSTLLQGEYGISDVMLSVPALIARQGVEQIIIGNLAEEEHRRLNGSAVVIRDAIDNVLSNIIS